MTAANGIDTRFGPVISTVAELEALYGAANPASLGKEIDHVNDAYAALIRASTFCAVATSGPGGLDCTPRGDPAGFVAIEDPRTLIIPDRRGNNRIDTLRNLVVDPRIAVLFLIPGHGETLRVNGRAVISVDPALLERFVMNHQTPRSAIVVTIERIYFQCTKAIVRSGLWNAERHIARGSLPTAGQLLAATKALPTDAAAAAYDAAYPERLKTTIY